MSIDSVLINNIITDCKAHHSELMRPSRPLYKPDMRGSDQSRSRLGGDSEAHPSAWMAGMCGQASRVTVHTQNCKGDQMSAARVPFVVTAASRWAVPSFLISQHSLHIHC